MEHLRSLNVYCFNKEQFIINNNSLFFSKQTLRLATQVYLVFLADISILFIYICVCVCVWQSDLMPVKSDDLQVNKSLVLGIF